MPKVNNLKGYYCDKINYRYSVVINDKYFTKKLIKKSFVYRDDYLYTKTEAEYNAIKLATYLLKMREEKKQSLTIFFKKIHFKDNRWI
jgi:hypothetical protein